MMTLWTGLYGGFFFGGALGEREQGFPEDGYYPGLLDASIRRGLVTRGVHRVPAGYLCHVIAIFGIYIHTYIHIGIGICVCACVYALGLGPGIYVYPGKYAPLSSFATGP